MCATRASAAAVRCSSPGLAGSGTSTAGCRCPVASSAPVTRERSNVRFEELSGCSRPKRPVFPPPPATAAQSPGSDREREVADKIGCRGHSLDRAIIAPLSHSFGRNWVKSGTASSNIFSSVSTLLPFSPPSERGCGRNAAGSRPLRCPFPAPCRSARSLLTDRSRPIPAISHEADVRSALCRRVRGQVGKFVSRCAARKLTWHVEPGQLIEQQPSRVACSCGQCRHQFSSPCRFRRPSRTANGNQQQFARSKLRC